MPRYFFHLRHATDDEGTEFQSLAEAKCHAVRHAGSLLCSAAERFWDSGEFEMTVTDEKGLVLFTLTLLSVEAPVIQSRQRASTAVWKESDTHDLKQ